MRDRAGDQDASAVAQIAAQLRGARLDVAAIRDVSAEQRSDEVAGSLLGRPLGGARALQLEADERADHPEQRRLRSLILPGPPAKLADLAVRDPQLHRLHALAAGQQLALLIRRG